MTSRPHRPAEPISPPGPTFSAPAISARRRTSGPMRPNSKRPGSSLSRTSSRRMSRPAVFVSHAVERAGRPRRGHWCHSCRSSNGIRKLFHQVRRARRGPSAWIQGRAPPRWHGPVRAASCARTRRVAAAARRSRIASPRPARQHGRRRVIARPAARSVKVAGYQFGGNADKARCAARHGHSRDLVVADRLAGPAQPGADDADEIARRQPPGPKRSASAARSSAPNALSSSASAPSVSTSLRLRPPSSAAISPRNLLGMMISVLPSWGGGGGAGGAGPPAGRASPSSRR